MSHEKSRSRATLYRCLLTLVASLTFSSCSNPTSDAESCWKASASSYEELMEYLRDSNDGYAEPLTEEQMDFLVQRMLGDPNSRRLDYTNCMLDRGWKCIGDPVWSEELGFDLRDVVSRVDGWTDASPFQCRNSDGVVVDMPSN